MLSWDRKRVKKALLLAVKIAIGCSAAIYISELLGLEFSASAGSITLLTLLVTKWGTIRLSLYRLITFALSAVLAGLLFTHLHSGWLAFGIYVFLMASICELLGWRATISVNAVIGVHFLELESFTVLHVWHELQLVLIGIVMAILLNLFHGNHGQIKDIARGMRDTETRLQKNMRALAEHLHNGTQDEDAQVWNDLNTLKSDIQEWIQEAYEYQENTFQDMGYYYQYLEMRLEQCNILINLHTELTRIYTMPVQAQIIADYMTYMAEYVVEINQPERQLQRLHELVLKMEQEPPPASREEFESRAILYHVLMDLEDFLLSKEKFVNSLSEKELKKYWSEAEKGRTS